MQQYNINLSRALILCALLGSAAATRTSAATFQINDPVEFHKIIDTNAVMTTHADLTASWSWIEGPVWVPSGGGYLIFSDMTLNRLKKLVPPSTLTDYWIAPADTFCNGNMLDLNERLVNCQAGGAALQVAILTNSVVTPVVTHYANTNQYYGPNDLTWKSDGTIWFTDPGYNSGVPAPPQPGHQPSYAFYQFDRTDGNGTVLELDNSLVRPNGICMSPDEKTLYVVDTGTTPHQIKKFNVTTNNTVTGGTVFTTSAQFDGIKCDVDGRVWAGDATGVAIYAPDGNLIGRIETGTRVANLCFGGSDYRTLYTVGRPYVRSIPALVQGRVALRKLNISSQGDQVSLTWPAPSTGFALEETNELSVTSVWQSTSTLPSDIDGTNTVTVTASNSAAYYRLTLD